MTACIQMFVHGNVREACLSVAACAAGALQLCVFRDLLRYSMASES